MQVRFTCPACNKSHVLDMPETTVHLTCSQTGKHMELRLVGGGEVKARIIDEEGDENSPERSED
ncbi:MAG: hypothetical protein KF841_00975 [Phycisphaerae bacterium]|nr:hypothetical protein [Phycisphaerae bacterium]